MGIHKRRRKAGKNPVQPIVMKASIAWFKANRFVDLLLQTASEHGLDLNRLSMLAQTAPDEEAALDDYTQLMQLIGYSVSGYGDLDSSPREIVDWADSEVRKLVKGGK